MTLFQSVQHAVKCAGASHWRRRASAAASVKADKSGTNRQRIIDAQVVAEVWPLAGDGDGIGQIASVHHGTWRSTHTECQVVHDHKFGNEDVLTSAPLIQRSL